MLQILIKHREHQSFCRIDSFDVSPDSCIPRGDLGGISLGLLFCFDSSYMGSIENQLKKHRPFSLVVLTIEMLCSFYKLSYTGTKT